MPAEEWMPGRRIRKTNNGSVLAQCLIFRLRASPVFRLTRPSHEIDMATEASLRASLPAGLASEHGLNGGDACF